MSLRVWLPLAKDLRNQGLDDVTVTNNGATFDSAGKLGGCYSFSGSSQKIVNTLPSTITSSVGSLSCWIKMNSLPGSSSFYNLIQLGNLGGYATCRLGLYMEYTNKINISIDGSSTGANVYTHSLVANQWYHICATYNGTIVKLYIDGNEVLSKTASKGSYTTAASYLYVGGTSSYYLNGYMNDARYYDHVLSPMEIKQLSQGLVLHYLLNRGGWGQENLFKANPFSGGARWTSIKDGCGVKIDWTSNAGDTYFYFNLGTGVTLTQGDTYTLSFQCSGMGSSVVSFYWCNLSGNSSMRCQLKNGLNVLTFQMPSNNITKPFFDDMERDTSLSNLQMWNFKLEKGSIATPWCPNSSDTLATTMGLNGTIEYDTSGFCNNANSNGSTVLTYSSDTPKYSVSTVFQSGSRIATPISASEFLPTDAITVSIWFKSSAAANRFLSCTEGGGFNFESASGKISFPIYIYGKGYTRVNGNTTWATVSDNQWHMITATYDKVTTKLYVDGVLDNQTASSYPNIAIGYSSTTPFTLGAEAQTITSPIAGTYVGNLSDCRVYATALSASDVKSLYQNSAYIDSNGNVYGAVYSEV